VLRASIQTGKQLGVTLTSDGAAHPVMRIGATPEDSESLWQTVPPLSSAAALGSLRPGAQVLAVVQAADGPRPLVAVQRYGQGRSMVFTGEASWRWRMQLPSSDRTYELFWRQAVRWLASGAPDRVMVAAPSGVSPGSAADVSVDVRADDYTPVGDAQVSIRVIAPGGQVQEARATLIDSQMGRYSSEFRFDEPGVYRISTSVARGGQKVGMGDRRVLVGGADLEMADPRLNEEVLRRIAIASGGTYLRASESGRLASLLAAAQAEPSPPELVELWHNVWIFFAVIMLLTAEWMLRRRWGLR
jgi:hypothetical protein